MGRLRRVVVMGAGLVCVALGLALSLTSGTGTESAEGEQLQRARAFVAEIDGAQRSRGQRSVPTTSAGAGPVGDYERRPAPDLHLGPAELIGLVGSPAPSPLARVRRDCPISAPLSDGHVLWMFCDSSVVGPDGVLTGFANTSAAFADDDAPAQLWEPVAEGGKPHRFLVPTDAYRPCAEDHQRFIWIESAVPIHLDDGRDRVVIYYQSVCVKAGEPVDDQLFYDGGVAEFVYDPAQPPTAGLPIEGRILNEQVFPRPSDGVSPFGQAAVYDDGWIYVYRCRSNGSCLLGRVGPAAAHVSNAYRYWNGVGWVPDPARAIPIVNPGRTYTLKPSVAYWPRARVFVMADTTDLATGVVGVSVSRSPQGPWSVPTPVLLPGCTGRHPYQCFGVEVHGDLSDRSALVFTYFNPVVGLELSPVGLARVPALALDRPEDPAAPSTTPASAGR